MQNQYYPLVLTPDYFKELISQLHTQFMKKHQLKKLPKNFQLYGYGNYDNQKPSLRKDFEEIGSDFINGKYLYDKFRQFHSGRPALSINKFYSTLLLVYLGYDSSASFFENQKLDDSKKKKQLALNQVEDIQSECYFLNYYFGESKMIIKGSTVITQNWKRVHHTFYYRNEDGSINKIYYSDGIVIKGRDTIRTRCKTLIDNRLYEGDTEIYYVGQNELSNLKFLLGNYCSFNLRTNTVSGRVILEKCESEEEMKRRVLEDSIPPYIAQEIRNASIET